MSVHTYPDSWLACSDDCKLDWAQRWVRRVSPPLQAHRIGRCKALRAAAELGTLHVCKSGGTTGVDLGAIFGSVLSASASSTCHASCSARGHERHGLFIVQLRAHFEDALKAGKPLVVGEFGKQHYSGMAVRRDFMARVYGEVEAWNARHGNVAGAWLPTHSICTITPGMRRVVCNGKKATSKSPLRSEN